MNAEIQSMYSTSQAKKTFKYFSLTALATFTRLLCYIVCQRPDTDDISYSELVFAPVMHQVEVRG